MNYALKFFGKISRLMVAVSILSIPAATKADSVQWGRTDFPPFTILSGPFAGKGVIDRMIDFYIDQLPQYDHKRVEASLTRVLLSMERGQPICHGSLLKKPEREKFAEFLVPNMVQFSNGILTSQDQIKLLRPHLSNEATIDFESLVRDRNLSIRYHANRSYSPLIDGTISRHRSNTETGLVEKPGMKDTLADVQMLLLGRLTGVIGRPAEAYFAAQSIENTDKLIFLPIGGQPKVQAAQIGCAKGNWNDQFIQDVNAITHKHRKSEEFKGFYTQWLPTNIRNDYSEILESYFPE